MDIRINATTNRIKEALKVEGFSVNAKKDHWVAKKVVDGWQTHVYFLEGGQSTTLMEVHCERPYLHFLWFGVKFSGPRVDVFIDRLKQKGFKIDVLGGETWHTRTLNKSVWRGFQPR